MILVAGLLSGRERGADLLPQPLSRAPAAGRPVGLGLREGDVGKSVQRGGNAPSIAKVPPDRQSLPVERPGVCIFTLLMPNASARCGKTDGPADKESDW